MTPREKYHHPEPINGNTGCRPSESTVYLIVAAFCLALALVSCRSKQSLFNHMESEGYDNLSNAYRCAGQGKFDSSFYYQGRAQMCADLMKQLDE